MNRRRPISASVLAALSLVVQPARSLAESIWVEGEDAATKDVRAHGWYNSVKTEVLSGGDWLSHYGDAPGSAEFRVEVRDGGAYAFWARLNPVASHPAWRIADGAWHEVSLAEPRGQQNIAGDNKPDHRFIAWVKVGAVTLDAGLHRVGFRWEGGPGNSGGLDCFVLTNESFVPQGAMRPGASGTRAGKAAPDAWFPLLADDDAFSAESVIDMSALVPAPAGSLGPLQADGKGLRFEKASTRTSSPVATRASSSPAAPGTCVSSESILSGSTRFSMN